VDHQQTAFSATCKHASQTSATADGEWNDCYHSAIADRN